MGRGSRVIRQRLVAGTVSNVAGKLTAVGTWFLLTPFILSRLGPHGYALWVLTGAIASYGFLLDFGIGGAIVKYVSEHVARGERRKAGEVVATAQWLYVGFGTVAVVLSILAAPVLVELLRIAPADHDTALTLVILTGANVATAIAFTPPMSVLRGLQRYDLYNGVSMFNSLLEAATTVIALLAGWGVVGLVALLIPANLATWVASSYLLKRVAPDLPLGWRGASMEAARRIVSFSSSLFAIDVSNRLQTKTDEFIIAMFRTVNAVTPYALARKLGDLAELASVQFLKVIMPLASELDAGDAAPKLRKLYIVASRVALAVAVPVAVILVVIGSKILTLWVGAEYAGYGNLLAVLAIARLIAITQWPASEILLGMGRHRFVAVMAIGAGLAHIGLSVLLLLQFGLLGVGVGTLIPYMFTSLCVVTPYANRTLGLSWGTALREIWAPGLVPGIAAGTVLWALAREITSPSFAMLGGWVLVTFVIYGVGYVSMPAAAAERQLIADTFASGTRYLRRLAPAVSRFV
jgi:O-antigen/teichoic acid export membrane protein